MATGPLMALLAVSGGVKAYGEYNAGQAANKQGRYESRVYGANADLAELQAVDAIARGAEAEHRQRESTHGLIGEQRAAAAAAGVDVNDGSALDLQKDSAAMGELDALMIRNNAAREAYGYKVDAFNARSSAVLARRGGRYAAQAGAMSGFSTLLTTAASIYSVKKGAK